MALLSVAEALARVTQGLAPLEAERVALDQAKGRVLAEDLAARLTQPPFDASAMDVYAVRAADVAALPDDLLHSLGLDETLGMVRTQGLTAIVRRIKHLASAA